MHVALNNKTVSESHPARGAGIEIKIIKHQHKANYGRTPQGVRGLKFYAHFLCLRRDESHPARGAWIEICLRVTAGTGLAVSHPARGAWIEISCFGLYGSLLAMSHPARGAWIEIPVYSVRARGQDRRTPQGVRGLKSCRS